MGPYGFTVTCLLRDDSFVAGLRKLPSLVSVGEPHAMSNPIAYYKSSRRGVTAVAHGSFPGRAQKGIYLYVYGDRLSFTSGTGSRNPALVVPKTIDLESLAKILFLSMIESSVVRMGVLIGRIS